MSTRNIGFIWSILKKYKAKIVIFLFTEKFIEDVLKIFIVPYILKIIGDKYINGTLTTTSALLLSFAYAFFFALRYMYTIPLVKYLYYDFNFKVEVELQHRLFKYALQHSMDYYNNRMSGTIAAKLNNATAAIDETLQNIGGLFSSMVISIIMVFIYWKINYLMCIAIVVWIILFGLVEYFSTNFINKYARYVSREKSKILGQITDSFVNISNVKSFAAQREERSVVKKQGLKILKSEDSFMKAKAKLRLVLFLFIQALLCILLLLSYHLFKNNNITFGTFLFIGQNAVLASFCFRRMSKQFINLVPLLADIWDALDTILMPLDIEDKKDATQLKLTDGKIVLKNLEFSYSK